MRKLICMLVCLTFASPAMAIYEDRDPTPEEQTTAATLRAEAAQLGVPRVKCVEDIMAIGGGVVTVSFYEVAKGLTTVYVEDVLGRVERVSKIENLQCDIQSSVTKDFKIQFEQILCEQPKYDKNRQLKGISAYKGTKEIPDFRIFEYTNTAAPRRNSGVEVMDMPKVERKQIGIGRFECSLNTN